MNYAEKDLIPLSVVQHVVFCERQCALIHVEQVWDENLFTAQGRIMHERVHDSDRESRGDVKIERGLPLRSSGWDWSARPMWLSFTEPKAAHGSLSLWSISGVSRNLMIAIRFSSAPRPCALRKCLV